MEVGILLLLVGYRVCPSQDLLASETVGGERDARAESSALWLGVLELDQMFLILGLFLPLLSHIAAARGLVVLLES